MPCLAAGATRAIQQLEEELSGPLMRREGKLSHLTDLGQRMLPLMQQCYQSALSAKSLASSLKKGAASGLSLALSQTVDMELLVAPLAEVQRAFPGLQISILARRCRRRRRTPEEGRTWTSPSRGRWNRLGRLDTWALFEDPFALVAHRSHPLAGDATRSSAG